MILQLRNIRFLHVFLARNQYDSNDSKVKQFLLCSPLQRAEGVIDDSGLPQQTEKPQGRYRDTDGKFKSSKSDVTKMKSDAVESFNQKYILRQSDGSNSWDWDLQTLFNDAMAGCAMTGLDMLKANAMKMAHIQYPQYYEKLFQRAIDTRVIQTTIDRHGRVVVISAYS